MQYTTRNEYKRKFPFGLILLLLALGFIAMAGISINKIRNGHDGFLTNLWEPDISIEPDPYLDGNPVRLDVLLALPACSCWAPISMIMAASAPT